MEDKKTENEKITETEKSEEKPLEKMTVVELREIAKGIEGVTGVHAMKKEELLIAIKADRGIEDQKPAKTEEKKSEKKKSKGTLDVKQVKKKVIKLRKEKADARKAKDKNKVDILRRRINRLKKISRKVAQG